jgi:surface protein
MFAYVPVETLDISSFDTRKVTNMHAAFYDMGNLKKIITGPNFSTSNVSNFGMMFDECDNLDFDYSKLDTRKAEKMYRMFGSQKVETLDLSTLDTSNVIDTMGMFANVKSKNLRLDNCDFSKVQYHGGNDYYDESVNIKMFASISNNTKIYVKDEAAKEFISARLQEAGKNNEVIIVNK